MDVVSRLIYCDYQEENGKDTRILRRIIRKRSKSRLVKFKTINECENINGNGYGSGYGNGSGYGSGSGYGFGNGNGWICE